MRGGVLLREKIKEENSPDALSLQDQGELKDDINNFLWSRVPGRTTVDEMEEIAGNFFIAICHLWR